MKTKQHPSGTLNNRPKSVRPPTTYASCHKGATLFRTLSAGLECQKDQLMSVNNGWMPEKIQQTNCHKLFDLSLRTNETKH